MQKRPLLAESNDAIFGIKETMEIPFSTRTHISVVCWIKDDVATAIGRERGGDGGGGATLAIGKEEEEKNGKRLRSQ